MEWLVCLICTKNVGKSKNNWLWSYVALHVGIFFEQAQQFSGVF